MKKRFYKNIAPAQIIDQLKVNLIESGFKVLAEVPTSEIMKKAGFDIPFIHQIYFFKPELINAILNEDHDYLMSAPIKLVVTCGDDSLQTLIRYQSFEETFFGMNSMVTMSKEADLSFEAVLGRLNDSKAFY